MNNTKIKSINDIVNNVITAQQTNNDTINITFGTNDSPGIHSQLGVPQLYHDQLDVIGKHLWNITHNKNKKSWTPIELQNVELSNNVKKLLPRHTVRNLDIIIKSSKPIKKPKKLTRRYLQQQEDWLDWFIIFIDKVRL